MWMPHRPNSRSESRGEVAATSRGTSLTAAATIDVKGAWVNLGAATSFDYEGITVSLSRANANYFVADIGISDGTNRWTLIEDLELDSSFIITECGIQLYIPVHVPAGAQLSARIAANVISTGCDIAVIGHKAGVGGVPGFSRCVPLFTYANARGPEIDPGATINTKGAWTVMTASCPNDIGAMFGIIGRNNDIARAAAATSIIDIGIGAAASEHVLYPNAHVSWSNVRDGPSNGTRIPIFAANVPAGTRIVARSACSLATAGDRTVDLALYGLVV